MFVGTLLLKIAMSKKTIFQPNKISFRRSWEWSSLRLKFGPIYLKESNHALIFHYFAIESPPQRELLYHVVCCCVPLTSGTGKFFPKNTLHCTNCDHLDHDHHLRIFIGCSWKNIQYLFFSNLKVETSLDQTKSAAEMALVTLFQCIWRKTFTFILSIQNYFKLCLVNPHLLFRSFPALSQEENESGRFLREHGSVDKTKAGQMMISVGKALSYTAQQRWVLSVTCPGGCDAHVFLFLFFSRTTWKSLVL